MTPLDVMIIVLGWGLAAAAGLSLAYWAVVWLYVVLAERSLPPLRAGLDASWDGSGEAAPPLVSIIIPAHNEEELIGTSLASILASDWPNLEIIIVADRCTDGTVLIVREIAAQDARVKLIENDHCPEGWSGKCHASFRGVAEATGEWLLFTDADTTFAPELVRASMGLVHMERLDFLTLLGRLTSRSGFERSAQPVAAMALMKMYPIHRANRQESEKRRPFANGQFMLFRRTAYEGMGTHERIKGALLEDLMFARRLNKHGYRMGLGLAGDLFTVRMYETDEEFRRGWKRIFTEGANRNIPRLRHAARRLRLLSLMPMVFAVGIAFGLWILPQDRPLGMMVLGLTALAFLMQFIALLKVYKVQDAPAGAIWRYPFGCATVASIFDEATADLQNDRGIEWAGMKYDVRNKEE